MPFIHANVNKLDDYGSDNDGGIIAVADIPTQPPHAPLVVNNTDHDNDMGSDGDTNDTERMTMRASLMTMQRATATNHPTWQRPLTRMATNQTKVKECKDCGTEERASPRSTPITI